MTIEQLRAMFHNDAEVRCATVTASKANDERDIHLMLTAKSICVSPRDGDCRNRTLSVSMDQFFATLVHVASDRRPLASENISLTVSAT